MQLPSVNQEENDLVPCIPDTLACIPEDKQKQVPSSNHRFALKNVKKPHFAVLKTGSGEKKMDMASCLRGAVMAHMVVGTNAVVLHKTRKPHKSMIAEHLWLTADPNLSPKNSGRKMFNTYLKIQSVVEASNNVFLGAIEVSK